MRRSLPPFVVLLGVAGLIPVVVCAIGAVGSNSAGSARMLSALIGYGAVTLAFVGAVHWGLVLAPVPDRDVATAPEERIRLALGVVPALLGWTATLVPLYLPTIFALLVLIAGFLLTAWQETDWARRELLLRSYLWLRWAHTIVIVALLVTVFTVRLLGGAVVL
jgi:hypothetical protein